jgi:stress-induced-phosphoprotein 1
VIHISPKPSHIVCNCQAKTKGNAALQSGKPSQAIEHYSEAIRLDGTNHVYYSNRSAAYLQQKNASQALEDAEACLGLKPDFPKGYSRKGAALHALKRYNDSMAAYQEGLEKFPNDAGLKNGLDAVLRENERPAAGTGAAGGNGGGLFSPAMMAQMALDPNLRPYLKDPEIMSKIKLIQANPSLLASMVQDPKMMEFLTRLMGGREEEFDEQPAPAPAPKKKKEPEPEPMQEEADEDEADWTPQELQAKEKKKKALALKSEGNDLYKAKMFSQAIEKYQEAIDLDPTNMTFVSNQAAVLFTQKEYEKCVEKSMEAIEVGKAGRAPFEERAKAYTRAARAYQKLGDLDNAIDMCNQAQLESYDKDTQRLLKTMELERKKQAAAAYLDDAKADEAKQRGNEFFRAQEWVEAVREYEEAVKRAPKSASIRNNLAAALCKILDFNGAKRHIEVALELDPKYVKAWVRKGDIEVLMKENHKAMSSYKKGLELDPDNKACKLGLNKVSSMVGQAQTEDEKQERAAHAMADPEIQAILQDPVMRQVLQDFQDNPKAAQKAMMDPGVRGKMEKLIASGIVQTA